MNMKVITKILVLVLIIITTILIFREREKVTKYGFTLIKIMCEGTPSRITSHGIRLTKIHIFVRVYRHELFSWEFTVTATLMKIMLLPGLHTCFHGGFLWYFVRVHRHEWISWDLCYFVRVRRHEWISWEFTFMNGFLKSLAFRGSSAPRKQVFSWEYKPSWKLPNGSISI